MIKLPPNPLIKGFRRFHTLYIAAAIGITLSVSLLVTRWVVHADTPMTAAAYAADPSAMIEAYRRVEVDSVSDAIEQLLHERRYMSHTMRPIFPAKFVGIALTVQLVKQENHIPDALSGVVKAVDTGERNSVFVMNAPDGADIAEMGGLMGTAMLARGFAGAVIDGGVRDLPELKKIGFPVFATGVVPSMSDGHYRFGASNVPITCGGVLVHPGDIISADEDGVVVVPREQAGQVLVLAQKLDFREHSLYPYIAKYHSMEEAGQELRKLARF
jgi:regulator of RNase E activity RraA